MNLYQLEKSPKIVMLFTMWQKKHIKIMQSSGLIITVKQGNLPCYQVDMIELRNTVKEFNHLFQINH